MWTRVRCLSRLPASVRTYRGRFTHLRCAERGAVALGQASRGHSSMLDVMLSAKGMASPHSFSISYCRILSNFLNGSLFL